MDETGRRPLPRSFFARETLVVAEALLGCLVVRELDDGRMLVARIVEVEAYCGPDDSACHAAKGRTPRTEAMFGPPGHAYVYLIYGIHHMLNFITWRDGFPCGVLIRALEPVENIEAMRALRPVSGRALCNGPGKLTAALGVTRALYGHDLTQGSLLWVCERDIELNAEEVARGPRVGIDYANPADRDAPWRLWLRDNPWVSKTR